MIGKIIEISVALAKAGWEVLAWFGWQKPLLSFVPAAFAGIWTWLDGLPWSVVGIAAFLVFGVSLLLASVRRFYALTVARDVARPDYAAWRGRASYPLWQASYLLADRTPDLDRKDRAPLDVKGWYDALTNAIGDGEIEGKQPYHKNINGVIITQPDTSISASDLARFCKRRGVAPKFLAKLPEPEKLPGVSAFGKMSR